MVAALDEVPAAGGLGECAALVRSAEALRFSAPELAVQLARRALVIGAAESATDGGVAQVDQARTLSMRAHAVLAAGLVRTSHYVEAAEPALAALALAESGGIADLATSVRLDLAACAREVGEPLLGCSLLRPVLEGTQSRPSVRAVALGRLVGCTAHIGRRDDLEDALAEADRLLGSDDSLSPDARRMERARLSVRAAAYHRWYGDTEDAVDAAREGLGQLNRLRGRRPETDRLRAQLVFELVCALLDEGEFGEAESASAALLAEPVRATAAAATGQLMLAVSTRIHLPSGRVERARLLLDQAVRLGGRHGLDCLLADALTEVSRLDEQAGHLSGALESLRGARSAEQRRLRATAKAARQLLAEVGAAKVWDAQTANALLRHAVRQHTPAVAAVSPISAQPAAETDEATGLLTRDALYRRLHAVRNGERPVALALVRLAENNTRSGVNLTDLAGWVRNLAPDNAELARSDGSELAVILPRTTRDQAEQFAQSIRETAIRSDWLSQANAQSISTGVGQSNPDAPTVDASALLTAARDALTPAEPRRRPGERTQPVPATALTAKALAELEDVGDTLRIGRAIINSLSIPSGSGGKRRAETGTHPELPDSPQHTPTQSSHTPTTPGAQAEAQSSQNPATASAQSDAPSSHDFAAPGAQSDAWSNYEPGTSGGQSGTWSSRESGTSGEHAGARSSYEPGTPGGLAGARSSYDAGTPGGQSDAWSSREPGTPDAQSGAWPNQQSGASGGQSEAWSSQQPATPGGQSGAWLSQESATSGGQAGTRSSYESATSGGQADAWSSQQPGTPSPQAGTWSSHDSASTSADTRPSRDPATPAAQADAWTSHDPPATAAWADTASSRHSAAPSTPADTWSSSPPALPTAQPAPSAWADASSNQHSTGPNLSHPAGTQPPEPGLTTHSSSSTLSPAAHGHTSLAGEAATHASTNPTADPLRETGPSAPQSSAGTISGSAESAPAQPGEGTGPSRPVGETGGYRPLISFQSSSEPEPNPPSDRTDSGYGSSYEETRAELARLMSALESGALPDAPGSDDSGGDEHGGGPETSTRTASPGSLTGRRSLGDHPGDSRSDTAAGDDPPGVSTAIGGRWSFAPVGESASPSGLTRYGDGLPTQPHQSIPTPPEPDDVPQPPRRPEVPDPDEPDPVPAPPPEPGPAAPDLGPGPSALGHVAPIPPSGPNATPEPGHDEAQPTPPTLMSRRERRAERSGGSSTIAGLLAEALVAYQETQDDDEQREQQPPPDLQDNDPPQVAGPGAPPDEGFESFDRLFDWPYQSPASGRHRSPE